MRKIFLWSLLALLIMIGSAACGGSPGAEAEAGANSGEAPLNVVTTIGMIADIAENVGGDRVEVTGLMGPGIDPHLYKASAGDVESPAGSGHHLLQRPAPGSKMGEVLERM